MLQHIVRSTVLLLASGVLMLHLTSAAAQYREQGAARLEKKTDAKAAARRAKRKSIEEFEEAEESLAPTAGAPECVWTGRRIVSLLWRNDINTARRYMDLYDQFTCSANHLKLAFRCVIEQGPSDPKAAEELSSRVHNCWINPDEPTTAGRATGSTTRSSTTPN